MKHVCGRCGREQSDTTVLCRGCSDQLRTALHRIRDLWPTLNEAIARQTALGSRTGNKPTRRDSQPLPVDLHASAVAADTRVMLVGWVRVIADDNHLGYPEGKIPDLCGWLHAHTRHVRRHEAGGECADEITRAAGRIVQAVDLPAEKATHPVGPCPQLVKDDPCPGTVHAHRHHDRPMWWDCDTCEFVWDPSQLNRLGVKIRQREKQIERQKAWGRRVEQQKEEGPVLASALTASDQYGIPLGTLYRWQKEGKLTRHGECRPYCVDLREVERLNQRRRVAG